MVSKWNKNKGPTALLGVKNESSRNFGTEKSVHKSTVCDCAIKKKGFLDIFPTIEDTVPAASVSSSIFFLLNGL